MGAGLQYSEEMIKESAKIVNTPTQQQFNLSWDWLCTSPHPPNTPQKLNVPNISLLQTQDSIGSHFFRPPLLGPKILYR